MVQQHVRGAQALAAGLAALPDTCSSAACTQAAWRFLNNERVGLSQPAKPLVSAVPGLLEAHCERDGLVMHDWSRLNFGKHTRKTDRLKMTHKSDVGYRVAKLGAGERREWQTAGAGGAQRGERHAGAYDDARCARARIRITWTN